MKLQKKLYCLHTSCPFYTSIKFMDESHAAPGQEIDGLINLS